MPFDNVIIFGAGASYDAGIPMLGNFVDTMWEYAIRGKSPHREISEADRRILQDAVAIRKDLEHYYGRASFNTRNLEDVLSLLSFEALQGGEELSRYQTWIKAISKTIESSTIIPFQKYIENPKVGRNTQYHWFWHSILGSDLRHNPPALISFNYDLTFERALWEYFHTWGGTELKPAAQSCKISYFAKPYDFVIESEQRTYSLPHPGAPDERFLGTTGSFGDGKTGAVEITYLKLHGSLNWSNHELTAAKNQPEIEFTPARLPTEALEDPMILPPVFNKLSIGDVSGVWQKALEILRQAKHIIIVGYSLPRTDIYMQYFLKSAVGPNSDLQWIKVFDPALFRDDATKREMEARYTECFSPQFKDRIIFQPPEAGGVVPKDPARGMGTFFHFVQSIKLHPQKLLFFR